MRRITNVNGDLKKGRAFRCRLKPAVPGDGDRCFGSMKLVSPGYRVGPRYRAMAARTIHRSRSVEE